MKTAMETVMMFVGAAVFFSAGALLVVGVFELLKFLALGVW